MSWHLVETQEWREPLDLAHEHAGSDMALLYSGVTESFSGQNSYLLLNPLEVREGSNWADLPPLPASGDPLPLWVGYLGYGMRDTPDRSAPSPIALPDFRLVRYGRMYHFHHKTGVVTQYQSFAQQTKHGAPRPSPEALASQLIPPVAATPISSNLTRAQYERIVEDTIAQIHAGNFYQANITRKFFGTFDASVNTMSIVSPMELFIKLCEASPAPYAAFIQHGDTAILSSSPECFLSVDARGRMTTRPIKGSARRSDDAREDKNIREALANSAKNHAENLMIVDLMRNDLSRVAAPESVAVVEQSALYSYRTIHHLISTIHAKKCEGVSVYDAVRACFPAGSMTGAPKLAAMRWCERAEAIERGVYSGAIGWFGPGDTCDLSVVIRTLLIQGNRFEFQVGGGIVADSTPEDEWRETLTKARGILAALHIREEELAAL